MRYLIVIALLLTSACESVIGPPDSHIPHDADIQPDAVPAPDCSSGTPVCPPPYMPYCGHNVMMRWDQFTEACEFVGAGELTCMGPGVFFCPSFVAGDVPFCAIPPQTQFFPDGGAGCRY